MKGSEADSALVAAAVALGAAFGLVQLEIPQLAFLEAGGEQGLVTFFFPFISRKR